MWRAVVPGDAECMTTERIPGTDRDLAGLGAVVVAGLVLLGLVVGAAVLVAQVVDLAGWVAGGS